MVTAFIGLGSNLGNRLGHIARAIEAIADLPETHVEAVSNAYESEAAYLKGQPDFVNAVVQVSTGLEAPALLAYLLDIETNTGRNREVEKGPRPIDLDLLLYGSEEWNAEDLVVPHPGLLERSFVVVPLLEIAPHVQLPDGTHPRRATATVGRILGDLGPVPEAGVGHDVPVVSGEWVVVMESTSAGDVLGGFDASLMLASEVLEQERIPFAFDPYAPGTEVDPFGIPVTYKLMVPEADAPKARALIEQVNATPPEFPPGLEE